MSSSIGSKQLILFFLGEINKIRVHPKAFLKHMEDRVKRFDVSNPKQYSRGDIPSIQYRTIQGDSAPQEAYDFLLARQNGKPLDLSLQLCEAAYVVGGRISREQNVDIQSYQGDLLTELTNNRCKCLNMDVILQYGFRKDRELVPSIVIDDGNELRTRRKALMNQQYNYIGMSIHPHKEFDYQVFILLADDVEQIIEETQNAKCQCRVM